MADVIYPLIRRAASLAEGQRMLNKQLRALASRGLPHGGAVLARDFEHHGRPAVHAAEHAVGSKMSLRSAPGTPGPFRPAAPSTWPVSGSSMHGDDAGQPGLDGV